MIDLVIVGAGPAGLCAAIAAAENGLKVCILDEFVKPGGRLLGQLHQEPNGYWWNGIEEAHKLHEKAVQLGIDIRLGVTVYDLQKVEKGWFVYTNDKIIKSRSLLLATGASEAPVPVPGWTLPGVMSIGAAQVMSNVHRVKPGEKCVVVGVNVLSLAIARELQLCGVDIEGIMLTHPNLVSGQSADPEQVMQSLLRLAHLAPSPFIRFGGKWVTPKLAVQFFPKKGFKMFGIPIQVRTRVLSILGEKQVEAVRVAHVTPSGDIIPGTEKDISVDFVCIAGGLTPLSELAAVAGCPFQHFAELGGYIPLHNEYMQTEVRGLYVAGNITGIESAKVAMAQGKVTGLTISKDLRALTDVAKIEDAVKNVVVTRRNALIQFHPGIEKARTELYNEFSRSHGKMISV